MWESCFFVPGLSQSACASWVQAWGSIVAIAAAIGIAWLQRQADRAAYAAASKAKAEVAGTSILLKLHPLIGCFQAVQRELDVVRSRPGSTFEAAPLVELLQQQPYPTEAELIALADHDPRCARWLIRGRNLAAQGELALRLSRRHSDPAMALPHVADLLRLAEDQLVKAEHALEALAPTDS